MTPPTRYALVPALPSREMIDAAREKTKWGRGDWGDKQPDALMYDAMLAASPNGGMVTAEMLERAARGAYEEYLAQISSEGLVEPEWADLNRYARSAWTNRQMCALTALGLTMADAREEAGNG